jgi:hypothetical protein
MLIAGIVIWLTLVLFFVALCRGAAAGDGRGPAATEGYPTASIAGTMGSTGAGANLAGLVLLEDRPGDGDQPAPAARDLRARARGARARAGQYAARS